MKLILLLDIDNCVSKDFFAYYPHHTTCTLYSADTEEQPIYTTSPGVHKVANFTIPMPALTGVKEGEKVDLTIKMYFGEVELKVEGKRFYLLIVYFYTNLCMYVI